MTYNFDPDRWFDNELAFLESAFKAAKISREDFEKELDGLNVRYEKMWKRLDGSYEIPGGDQGC